MNLFVRAWKGEASLAAAFWLVYVLFGVIVALIITLIFSLAVRDFNYYLYQDKILALRFPYTLYSTVCVWRCAKNSALVWRVLARIIVVLGLIGGLLNIFHAINRPDLNVRR